MGMFDSVYIRCPDCGTSIEFQSKTGDCCCIGYTLDDVPSNVARGIDGDIEECPECGRMVQIKILMQILVL